jgi:acetolactate decarboxylase
LTVNIVISAVLGKNPMKIKPHMKNMTNILNNLVLKKFILFSTVLISVILLSSCAVIPEEKPDVLVQTSTIDALLDGVYDGYTTFGTLKKYGDFGIGTFNGLDGEMIALDGLFYQVKSNGVAYNVRDSLKTPFSVVTFFHFESKQPLKTGLTFAAFKKMQKDFFESPNIFYAIKIEGKFKNVRVRSVPKQVKPYPQLKEVVKHQKVYDFKNIEGTILGFYCPSYVKGINVPGFHLHFINEKKNAGGHVLDFIISNAVLEIDEKYDFFLSLPKSNAFRRSNLKKDRTKELHKVEQ